MKFFNLVISIFNAINLSSISAKINKFEKFDETTTNETITDKVEMITSEATTNEATTDETTTDEVETTTNEATTDETTINETTTNEVKATTNEAN
jgi:cytoskeletal protein RodZ